MIKAFISGAIIGAVVWSNRYEIVELAGLYGPTAGEYIQGGINNVLANINEG